MYRAFFLSWLGLGELSYYTWVDDTIEWFEILKIQKDIYEKSLSHFIPHHTLPFPEGN